ncbi:MAG: hypothetical protein ACRBCT_01690 [Alphaproteobacteria bacterium]
MKILAKFLSIALIATSLSACKTFDAIQEDVSSINWPTLDGFTSAVETKIETSKTDTLIAHDSCPQIEIVNDLATINEQTSTATISTGQSTCTYKSNSVTVDMKLQFDATANTNETASASASYPFFVAVTDAGGNIMAKEIFSAPVTFSAGTSTQTHFESLRQIIPIDNRKEGARIKIMSGFQLTKEQLAENRQKIANEKIAEAEALAAKQATMQPSEAIKETQKIIIEKPMEPEPAPQRAGPIDITTPN